MSINIAMERDISLEMEREIQQEVIDPVWMKRVIRGFSSLGHQKGRCFEVAAIIGTLAGTVVFGTAVVFSAWASYLLFEDTVQAFIDGERPPADVGHAGEWSAQVIMYSYLFTKQIYKILKEGDYLKVQTVYKHTVEAMDEGDITGIKKLRKHLENTLGEWGPLCIIRKGKFTQYDDALATTNDKFYDEQADEINTVLLGIRAEVDQALSGRRYFQRSWTGFKEIGQLHGKVTQVAAVVTGVVLPSFLLFQAFLSFVGTALITQDVIEGEEDLSDLGHVGEWPANGIGFTYMAKTLNTWAITSIGDFKIATEIIHRHVDQHENSSIFNKLKKVANEEIKRLASLCMFSIVPGTGLY